MTPKTWMPHNYQLTAVSFLLSNPRSGLFLDPGLGKTSISLAVIKILMNANMAKGILMIAPLRVCYSTWSGEIEKWANFKGMSTTILHDDNKSAIWDTKADIYLLNPEGLPWIHEELLTELRKGKKPPFNVLWVDESTKFKNYDSVRFQLLVDMLPLFKRRHIMTGTPSPKNLLDLWSQIYILDEGKSLGVNYHEFRNEYFQADDWNKYDWQIKDFAAERIHAKAAPLILQMSAEDYLDMPPLVFNDIKVKLPEKAYKHYKQMEREFFTELDGLETSAEATAQSSMKCHQIANGRVYEDIPEGLTDEEEREFLKTRKTLNIHKTKIEALADLIDELNGKPLLVAYHYKHDLQAIQKLLGKDVPYIGSGVSGKQAKQIEQDWNTGKIPVLLGHPASMAHGLNLQDSGNDICWFSLTWNLEEYDQFYKRIWRQGVVGGCRVHHLVAEGTTDEAMLIRLGERAEQQTDLKTALKQYRLSQAV